MIGKSRQYEIMGESDEHMIIRFLIHFLFVSHDSYSLELFDTRESQIEEKKISNNLN